MDLYRTKTLIGFIETAARPSTFLRDRYAPTNDMIDIFGTESVLVEYRDGERRIAPIVTEYSDGVPVSRNGERMKEFKPPRIDLYRPLTNEDIKKRTGGEPLLPNITNQGREVILVTRDMVEIDGMIARREEWMTAQVLVENALKAKAVNADPDEPQELDVKYYEGDVNPATKAIGTTWDQPDADPFKDIAEGIEKLEYNGMPAEDLICSPDAADALLRSPSVQKFLDNRRYEWGASRPSKLADGAAIVAVLNVGGYDINVISYGGKYVEGEGKKSTVKPFLPNGTAVLTAPNCLRTVYGAVSQVEENSEGFVTYPNRRVPKRVKDVKGNSLEIHLSSRPLVIPNGVSPAISMKPLSE